MKKTILVAALVAVSLPGIAQYKYVVSANLALKSQNFEEAKEQIDKAMANPETAKNPKALFAKAQIYNQLQGVDKYKADNPWKDAMDAALELANTKPEHERDNVSQMLMVGAFLSFNEGVRAYNDKEYKISSDMMKKVISVAEMDGGKRFDKMPPNARKQMDTVVADAYLTMANATFFGGDMANAIPLLIKVKNNPIRNSPAVYQCLVQAYEKENNEAQQLAMIAEGRKTFPSDATLRNLELNYYIKTGKTAELIKKLEEASAKEPGNSDLQFNLATIYMNMANPKDGSKPANQADIYKKAETAFTNAVKINPENAVLNYNFGALYFNQATGVNDQMNAITGSTKADIDKYDALKKQRDDLFVKSAPYFEKAQTKFGAVDASSLNDEDMRTYKSTLLALSKIYAIQSKLDKSSEMKKLYEGLK